MQNQAVKYHPYRWVVLSFYSLITVVIEIQWLAFASITEVAKSYYQVSNLGVDFLSMIYMLVFIVGSIPASYYIDTYGLKNGLILGAALTGIFGLIKAFSGNSYTIVVISQFGLALAQPLILNAITKIGAKWFPHNERATVAGIGTLAQYVGIVIALVLTPFLVNEQIEGFNFNRMLMIYGAISAISAILVILLAKDPPKLSVVSENASIRISPKRSIIHILKNRDMQLLILLFLIGLGIFNAISTCIDQITSELTMTQTGFVGGIMLIGGIIGATILPILSDRQKKRKPFLVICMIIMLPGIIGLSFFSSLIPLLISAFVFGFAIMSAGPIAFQYGAEVSFPATESMAQGIMLMAGQVSGIVFVYAFNVLTVNTSMLLFIALTVLIFILSLRIRESYNLISS